MQAIRVTFSVLIEELKHFGAATRMQQIVFAYVV